MRKLIIYRGETRQGEIPLTGKTMRLGRRPDNDIVLDDPGKGVSRAHAELRPEGDQYRLVDLDSQNGIWVSGARVPSVLLTKGVVAAIGPYRVAIDASSPKTQVGGPIVEPVLPPDAAVPAAAIEATPLPAPPAPSDVVDGPGALLDTTAVADSSYDPTPLPAPVEQAAPQPVAMADAATGPVRSSSSSGTATVKQGSPGGGGAARTLAGGVMALLLIAASGLGAYKFVQHRRPPPRVWDVAATTALINSGKCQEALDTQINPALKANATDPEALALKQRCTPSASTSPAAPPPAQPFPMPDVKQLDSKRLDEAEASIAANACQSALETVNAVLADDPADERAKSLAAKANACLSPAPVAAKPAASDAAKIAVQDGVEVKQGESKAAYAARVADLRKDYQDAITALREQRFADAAKILDAMPQGYRDVPQQRAAAQSGVRDAANRAYAAARAAEQQQEWTTATRAYQRARDLDGRDVSADLTRMTEQKTRIGQQACKDGQAQYLYGHNAEAAAQFQKAIELLPPNDPCYTTAKERLAEIRKQ